MTANDPPVTDRRRLLAGLASAGVAATAGCAKRAHSLLNRPAPEQVSLTIKTVPADDDPVATRIARNFAEQLAAVGIDSSVQLQRRENLLIDVLYKHAFDCYVWRLPPFEDPDAFRPLVHSEYGVEAGWQNPFGFSDLEVDDLLERQRAATGGDREAVVDDLQERVATATPFVPIAVPDEIRGARSDVVTGVGEYELHSPLGYLSLDAADAAADEVLRVSLKDTRPTVNLNPLTPEYRRDWTIQGLLYDPLVRRASGEFHPWLASDLAWRERSEGTEAVLALRPGATWHDGTPVDAEDVAFTVQFLRDTSMGRQETPLPAPVFRGETTLIEDVTVLEDDRIRVRFVPNDRSVALRALTVPILPKHVWESTTGRADVLGIRNGPVTTALVRDNLPPVGSGPLRFEARESRSSLTLARSDEHFLHGEASRPEVIDGGFAFDRLVFGTVPSSAVATNLLLDGEVHATGTPLDPTAVTEISTDDRVKLDVRRSRSPYHVGFDVRSAPLSNVRFRQAVAQLLDKPYLVDELLDGFGAPVASPLVDSEWTAASLRFEDEDPVFPFPGEDGELDLERAKSSFREAGYRYADDGRLLTQ